jgi:hypothetical protein
MTSALNAGSQRSQAVCLLALVQGEPHISNSSMQIAPDHLPFPRVNHSATSYMYVVKTRLIVLLS